jgi:ABC-type transport system involved in multi-copper enzyme maturation permease subunit
MLAIASSVIADAVRRKVVWVVLLFAAVLSLAIPSLPSYGMGVVQAVFREVAIALMYAAAFVVALALSATRVPAEVERRTVFNILSRDVRRWHYVVGSWLGMFAVVGASLAAFTVVAIVVGQITYGHAMFVLLEAALAVWLEMGAIMAFTVMMSTRFGVVTSVVAALAFVFVGHSVGTFFMVGETVQIPWYVPTLDVFNVINPVAHGAGYGLGYAASMVLAFTAWSGLLLLAGSALFDRRDL